MIVTYIQKIQAAFETPELGKHVLALSTRSAFQFDFNKILSPGIRQAAHSDLDAFFESTANQTTLPPGDIPKTVEKEILATELEYLAQLIRSGERVASTSIFNSFDGTQTIQLQVKKT